MNKFVLMVHVLFMGDRPPIDRQAHGGSRNRPPYHFGTLLNRRLEKSLTIVKSVVTLTLTFLTTVFITLVMSKIFPPPMCKQARPATEKFSQARHFSADFIPVTWAATMPYNARSSFRP
jgi:hypothetical protein